MLVGLIFGVTFKQQLEQVTQTWISNPKAQSSYTLNDKNLQLSYTGICLGAWLFLGGGFRVLGFGVVSAYGFALLVTLGTGAFMWQQFGEMLMEVKEKGSKSLDLDEYID